METQNYRHYGWIVLASERLFALLQSLSVANWLFRKRTALRKEEFTAEQRAATMANRAWWIDTYVFGWIVVQLGAACAVAVFTPTTMENGGVVSESAPRGLVWGVCLLVGYRVFEILQATINMNIFDRLRTGVRPNYIVSITRTLLLNLINFLELVLCFGVIYAANLPALKYVASTDVKYAARQFDAYYFSAITQLTVGYGDLVPTGWLKAGAALQGLCGFLFTVLILGRFVSFLPRSKVIIEEE